MIKAAIQYVVGLGCNEMVLHDERTYSTRQLHRVGRTPGVSALTLRSLSGLVDYIKSNFDQELKLMVHVESPTSVSVFDSLDHDNDRRIYVQANAMLPHITFERFQDSESFNIMLQSCFVKNDHRDKLLNIVGSIVEDEAVTISDNGVSQRVAARTGVAAIDLIEAPNPIKLKPFRTFVEVTQPESEFILRLRKGPEAALFEADGAAWELNAMENIKEHLAKELKDLIEQKNVIIVA